MLEVEADAEFVELAADGEGFGFVGDAFAAAEVKVLRLGDVVGVGVFAVVFEGVADFGPVVGPGLVDAAELGDVVLDAVLELV
ncbi:MAG: hypothetical protein HC824_09780 [Synechococcales cyanobacterium RM1_1_8]|nr:hypothetical protein [Synechococcales cyanobacterium RM1_1_8]